MDRLSGCATLIMQTGAPAAKIINVAENNFAQVYFTPHWMEHLPAAHEPLSLMVAASVRDVQVPVVAQHRAQLGNDKATQNIQGYTHVPSGFVPTKMALNGHSCSPWRGGRRGPGAKVINISDSDDSDNENGAMPSTPSRPSSNTPNPAALGFGRTHPAINEKTTVSKPEEKKDVTMPALCAGAASLKDGDLKRYASPNPFTPRATPTAPSTPFPAPAAINVVSNSSSQQERYSLGSTISTVSSITTSPSSPNGTSSESVSSVSHPTASYYTRFNPIIPPGPSSERWLAENGWSPRFANVLREVAEENSLGSWADILVENHGVERESAGAMVRCLLKDFELQSLPPSY